jgi:hypothetical protein
MAVTNTLAYQGTVRFVTGLSFNLHALEMAP